MSKRSGLFEKLNMNMSALDFETIVDQIWLSYDDDNSGELNKEETMRFVQDTLGNLGQGDEFSMEAFDEVFYIMDKDGDGTIDKSEMVEFIRQLLNNDYK